MAVVLIIVAVVIVGGVGVVAMGRGGELAEFAPDDPTIEGQIGTGADVPRRRPPGSPGTLGRAGAPATPGSSAWQRPTPPQPEDHGSPAAPE